MKSYCVRCKKYIKIINPRVSGTNNGKAMKLSKCATWLKIKKQKDY